MSRLSPRAVTHTLVFHDPLWLLALLALPLAGWLRGRRRAAVFLVPFAAAWHRPSLVAPSRAALGCAVAGGVLFILALARPQRHSERVEIREQGYDIMLAIDLSRSMLTEDYLRHGQKRVSRMAVLRPVIDAFIHERPHDRIGIVVFAGRAYTLAPLTFDHAWLARQLERLTPGMIEDGTAIGDGLALALLRLGNASRERNGKRDGAFAVLMTDGESNAGRVMPWEAQALAVKRGVPVYTIAIGTSGRVELPIAKPDGTKGYLSYWSHVDHATLWRIATYSGGHFYNANDSRAVTKAFQAIDQARKIQFQKRSYIRTTELFPWLAVPGVLLLGAALWLARPREAPPAAAPA